MLWQGSQFLHMRCKTSTECHSKDCTNQPSRGYHKTHVCTQKHFSYGAIRSRIPFLGCFTSAPEGRSPLWRGMGYGDLST